MPEVEERRAGARRLVLGFNGGCGTCLALAKRIDERMGDRLEVQNLRDPRLMEWRRQALGEDAPWAPTLFEVKGEKVRAWTGKRMGLVLTRFLGPVATWKVMQVLGEMGTPAVIEGSPVARVATGMSRGQFLKGVGGAAAALSVLSATGKLASPAEAATTVTKISGDQLVNVGRAMATRKDFVNVGSRTLSDSIKNGNVFIKQCYNGDCVVVVGSGPCSVQRVDGQLTIKGNCSAIRAARHTLRDGNSLMAVSYKLSDGRIISYWEYKNPEQGIKSESAVWRVSADKKRLLREKFSHNRVLDKPVPVVATVTTTAAATLTAAATDPCGGCYAVPPQTPCSNAYHLDDNVVTGIDLKCAVLSCGPCAFAGAAIEACLLAWCPFAVALCANVGQSCVGCYGTAYC